jgi:hypothetical protein
MYAVVMGLRGKATAMLVPRVSRVVCSAASTRGRKASWAVSEVQAPSKPMASASRASLPASDIGPPNRTSSCMGRCP